MSTGDTPGGDRAVEHGRPAVGDDGEVTRPHRSGEHHHLGDHQVFIDESEDRWEWRRKIRADPRKLHFYRIAVAIAGALLVLLGVASGPLPGPGGIPLVLLGLAVWASEFEWAHRLMQRFKQLLHRFRTWSRPKQVLGWVIFFAVIGVLAYGYLLIIGIPVWLPDTPAGWLHHLPGV